MQWSYPNDPKLWQGATVYIVGGGPSLKKVDLKKIHAEKKKGNVKVLGVNKSFTLMSTKTQPLCDAVFIGDNKFYLSHKETLKDFTGLKITAASRAVNEPDYYSVYRVNEYFTMKPGKIGWASNSGNAAINLAAQLGAKMIVLVGFDMGITPGSPTNWHSDNVYEIKTRKRVSQHYYDKVIDRIESYTYPRLSELGIEVINTNEDSGLECFLKVPFDKWMKTKDKDSYIFGDPDPDPEGE